MDEIMSIEKLRNHLAHSAESLQKFSTQSSCASDDSKLLFDKLAQEYNYMFSYIIDYLEQH